MTNQRFDELLKQIKDYAEECNDAQKIIQYLDKLMEDVGPRYADRPGGYTRILKLSDRRKGDNAPMAIIELV